MSNKRMVLLLLVVLCAALVECKKSKFKKKSKSKSSECYNDNGEEVDSGDCPHNCCVSGSCGTESECKTALIIGLSVAGGVVLCGCIVAAVVYAYMNNMACFGSREGSASKEAPKEVVIPDEEMQPQANDEPAV